MKTLAQEDSKRAYEQISNLPEGVDREAYRGLCHDFPMLILRSGLCQAMAFYTVKATSKNSTNAAAYRAFLKHMVVAADQSDADYKTFQQRIVAMELAKYQRTTRRILAAAIWYKRFAISYLDVEEGEVSND